MRVTILLMVAALSVVGSGALIKLGSSPAALSVGGLLVLSGLPLLILARRQLGSAFAFTPQAKGLVTQGLYSRIPHPMYLFLDLVFLGGITMLRQAWLLALWAALVVVQALQARRETKMLEDAFGDEYRDYRRRTWW